MKDTLEKKYQKTRVPIWSLPILFTLILSLFIQRPSNDNQSLLDQLKEVTKDQSALILLNNFHSDEEFLNFLVPEQQKSYTCSAGTSSDNNFSNVFDENGVLMLNNAHQPTKIISSEQAKNFIETILNGVVENRKDVISNYIDCNLWSIRILDNGEVLPGGTNRNLNYFNQQLIKNLYSRIDELFSEYSKDTRHSSFGSIPVTIFVKFEYKHDLASYIPGSEEYDYPEIMIEAASPITGITFPLEELGSPFRELIFDQVMNSLFPHLPGSIEV